MSVPPRYRGTLVVSGPTPWKRTTGGKLKPEQEAAIEAVLAGREACEEPAK